MRFLHGVVYYVIDACMVILLFHMHYSLNTFRISMISRVG